MIQLSWTSVLSVIVSCGILQSPWPLKRPKSALVMYRVVIQLFVLPFLLGILDSTIRLMIPSAKAALAFVSLFFVFRYEIQQDIPSSRLCQLLNHLCQDVIINVLRKPPGLLVCCSFVPTADTGVVEVPYNSHSL